MAAKRLPSEAVTQFLNSIPHEFRPQHLYPDLLGAAARLSFAEPEKAARDAAVMMHLLGSAAYYGSEHPMGPPVFPADHAMHPNWGTEWYWLTCNLTVDGTGGLDRIGVLVDIPRIRPVSISVQNDANWTDEEAQICFSMATVTVATRKDAFVTRRRTNIQWPAMSPGGLTFSVPGQPFLVRCGLDSLQSSSPDVLPLRVRVDDGSNIQIDLTFTTKLEPEHAFFVQGIEGHVILPGPGIYYSWPQLAVSGHVTASGHSYAVSGTGWIDHQVMMQWVGPPIQPPSGARKFYQGWSWCGLDLRDGRALTAAGFQDGDEIKTDPPVPTGLIVREIAGRWQTSPVAGAVRLSEFESMLHDISMPTSWTWLLAEFAQESQQVLEIHARAWDRRCDLESENLTVFDETPVDLARMSDGIFFGTGYCESVGFETVEDYERRALAFLRSAPVDLTVEKIGRFRSLFRFMKKRS